MSSYTRYLSSAKGYDAETTRIIACSSVGVFSVPSKFYTNYMQLSAGYVVTGYNFLRSCYYLPIAPPDNPDLEA